VNGDIAKVGQGKNQLCAIEVNTRGLLRSFLGLFHAQKSTCGSQSLLAGGNGACSHTIPRFLP